VSQRRRNGSASNAANWLLPACRRSVDHIVHPHYRLPAPPDQADVQAALGRLAKAEAQQKVESQAVVNQQQRAHLDNQRAYQATLEQTLAPPPRRSIRRERL